MSLYEGSARKARPGVLSRRTVEAPRPKATLSASIKRAVTGTYRNARGVQGRSGFDEIIDLVLNDSPEQDGATSAGNSSGLTQKRSISNQTTPRQLRPSSVGASSSSAGRHISREVSSGLKEDTKHDQIEFPSRASSERPSNPSKHVDAGSNLVGRSISERPSNPSKHVDGDSNLVGRSISERPSNPSKHVDADSNLVWRSISERPSTPSKHVDADSNLVWRSISERPSNSPKHVDVGRSISERPSKGVYVDDSFSPRDLKKAIDADVSYLNVFNSGSSLRPRMLAPIEPEQNDDVEDDVGGSQPLRIQTKQLANFVRRKDIRCQDVEDENEKAAWRLAETFLLQTKKTIKEKLMQEKEEEEDRIRREAEKRQQILAQEKHKRKAVLAAELLAGPENVEEGPDTQKLQITPSASSTQKRLQKIRMITSHRAYAEQVVAFEEMQANAKVQAEVVKAQKANPFLSPEEIYWIRRYKLALEMQRQDESATEQAEQQAQAAFGKPGTFEPNAEALHLVGGF